MIRPASGYLLLKHVKVLGARLHVHWSAVAVAGIMLGAWRRQPGLALEAVACYFGLILLHEAGHAAMARRLGYWATDIHLSAIHGRCTCDAPETPRDEALLAWGGVLAQLAVALPLLALDQVPGFASLPFAGIPVAVLGYYSVALVAFNLVPTPPMDGAKAWKLLPILAAGLRAHGVAATASREASRPSVPDSRRAAAPSAPAPASTAADDSRRAGPESARWLALACARLSKADVTWPEIGHGLNPQHDRVVSELIQRVRASHMGAPLQGLQLIESACLVALEDNEDASGVDALTSAVEGLGTLEKVRW